MVQNIKKNTAKLMMQKLQSELDALFAEQQTLNGDNNGTPQRVLPKADGGIKIPQLPWENRTPFWPQGGQQALGTIAGNYTPNLYGGSFPNVNVTGNYPYHNAGGPRYNQLTMSGTGYTNPGPGTSGRPFGDPYQTNFNIPALANNASWSQTPAAVYGSQKGLTGSKSTSTGSAKPTFTPNIDSLKYTPPVDNWQPTTTAPSDSGSKMTFSNPLDDPNSPSFNPGKSKADAFKAASGDGLNWSKVGTFAGQVAPMVYNMVKGLQKPEKTIPNYNPYENEIRSTMRNRRFNIDPTLSANRTAQAVSNRNIGSAANSRGELMSNLGAAQNYRMTGDAAAYAQKNNMDNQYLAEQAQMDAQLGSQRAAMDWNTQTANSQNKAATNSFLGQGFNDLGRFAQTQQLMGNQMFRDSQLASLYPDMYSQIYQYQPAMQEIVNAAKTPKKFN